MAFTHDFSVTLTVEGSTDERGCELSDARLLEALKVLVTKFEETPGLLRYHVSDPVSTRETSLWMLRKIGEPGCVRQADGGWVQSTPGELRRQDMLTSEEARAMKPPKDAFWCPPEDVHGMGVIAEAHSDDGFIVARMDVRPWLAEASGDDILQLARDDWSYEESADRVAMYLENMGEPEAVNLFVYLGLANGIGFGVSIPGDEALDWLSEVRPEVFAQVEHALQDDPAP